MFVKFIISLLIIVGVVLSVLVLIVMVVLLIKVEEQVVVFVYKVKCYGVVLKGQNDCVVGFGIICQGMFNVDFQGNVWKFVQGGICELIVVLGGKYGLLKLI